MKKRLSIHKEDLLPIEKALAKSLKNCQCYWGELEQCHDCAELQPVYDRIKEVVDVYLKRRKEPEGA